MSTLTCVKRAWIRNPGQPVGKPGLGRINCTCGQAPETYHQPGPDINCTCGTVYTWDGYVVNTPEPHPLAGLTYPDANGEPITVVDVSPSGCALLRLADGRDHGCDAELLAPLPA